MSVSIGGTKKQIQARLDAQPDDIALRFVNELGVDTKYLKDLTRLINDQINQIKTENGGMKIRY